MKISEITRRNITDAIQLDKIIWYGRVDEIDFLSRLYDLKVLPSEDRRYSNAQNDIQQHRINNYDWGDDWIFYDDRFELQDGDDEIFLRFLCETIHPIVRPNIDEAKSLFQMYNRYLINDGFEIVEATRISGQPVYTGKFVGVISTPGINAIKEFASGINEHYVTQQITRMESAVPNDPYLAIGTAKEFLETCCKTILDSKDKNVPSKATLTQLVKSTIKELSLTPDDIPEKAAAAKTIKILLSNLATIAQGLAELRNVYGTGHGQKAKAKGLTSRHAKLAVGAVSTLAIFLIETHQIKT